MTSEEDALQTLLARMVALPGEKVALINSLGRFASKDVFALRPLPAFDNSAMDGYAVQAVSCRPGARLCVVGEQAAGADRGLSVGAAQAVRIFTGAPLPAGADAVIMQEDVAREGDIVVPKCCAQPGEFIRRQGADLAAGQKILGRGENIGAHTLALLAAQGIAAVETGGLPRVAITSTGDESVRVGEDLGPGQLFESNSFMLHALVYNADADVLLVEHCPDSLERMIEAFRRGLDADVLIVSGGVSVGDHDLVKPALRALGAEIDLWRVALKPGKPFLFGRAGRCSVFGLPGNPVSAFVTFLKFVRPALRKMMGAAEENLGLRKVTARLATQVMNEGDRPHYLRGRVSGGVFTLFGRQESHALFSLSQSNALLRAAAGARFSAGETVTVEIWE